MDEQKTYCDIKNGCMICDHLLCEGKNEPINIEAKLPHIVQETMCVKCLHRWIDVRPESTWLKNCECPNCGEIGYVIGTGQILPNEDELKVGEWDA